MAGIHVVAAVEPETLDGQYLGMKLPPSLFVEQQVYQDIRFSTLDALARLYSAGLTDPARRIKWFMKVDDDTYVRSDKLLKALEDAELAHAADPSKILLYGYPWQDLDTLSWSQPYCWGGPGYILSWGALEAIGPHLAGCRKAVEYRDGLDTTAQQVKGGTSMSMFGGTVHFGVEYEDMVIGRCLSHHLGKLGYEGCTHIPGQKGTEFLSLWADNEVHQWDLLSDGNLSARVLPWTQPIDGASTKWSFDTALTLHKAAPELMDMIHDSYTGVP